MNFLLAADGSDPHIRVVLGRGEAHGRGRAQIAQNRGSRAPSVSTLRDSARAGVPMLSAGVLVGKPSGHASEDMSVTAT
jgi:hypothetical protein